jgi:YD repeat-containing protein
VILPSGKEYQLTYDDAGGLRSVITPAGSHHHFHSVTLIGRQRYVYRSPGASNVYIRDYDGAGRLVDERYPSDQRRVAYRYDGRGRLAAVYYDWVDIAYVYDDDAARDAVANVSVISRAGDPFACSVRYDRDSSLVVAQETRFAAGPVGVVGAVFRYSYGPNFRLATVEATVGGRRLPVEQLDFDPSTGSIIQLSPFTFERMHVQRHVTRDLNVEILREFDTRGRPTDVWYRFNNHVVFTVETKYDSAGRVHQWRRKVVVQVLLPLNTVKTFSSTIVTRLKKLIAMEFWRRQRKQYKKFC